MAHIVDSGRRLRRLADGLRDEGASCGTGDHITVVSNGPNFHFVPSNPWVAVNWRKRDDIEFPAAPYLAKKGIEFDPRGREARASGAQNQVELGDGTIARLRLPRHRDRARSSRSTRSRAWARTATRSRSATSTTPERRGSAWDAFVKDPGPIVVGAVQGASCFGPAYEFAFIMDTDLRRRKIRDQRADDLRHRRALHRPPRPGRRRRLEDDARVGAARPAHQVDLQRQGHEGRGREDARRPSTTRTASRRRSTRCRSSTR